MYRVESFLTSFILSYADKYIKNFKRSDAQLHLWEGQACFHNLELDLEALESLVPFHFVSGHINELRIKVPWTSLGSSSVEVVIDTIECVMKFKSGQNDTDSNNAASSNSPHRDSQPSPSPSPTLDPNLPSLEPGTASLTPVESSNSTYMISLVRRVLSNLKIVCNNVILKIIEEDTVLSLNIKTIQCDSVDEKWLPAFTELSPKDLFLRKRIKLLDITICLDRRSSSGHIVTFLEPLLFKCSLEMRLCQQFDKNYETRLTRLDVCCDKMRYIVSKPQLYLLLKILELVVNLKKVISKSKLNSSHGGPQPPSSPTGLPPSPPSSPTPASPQRKEPPLPTPTPLLPESSGGEEVGWFGWAWRLIPSLLVDEELGPALPRDAVTGHTLRIGLYIKQLQLSLKLRIDNILVSSNGTCPCGVKSMDEVLITTSQTIPDQTEVLNLTSKPTCSKWQRTKQKVNQVKDSLQNLGEKFGNSAIKLAEDSYVHLTTALSVDNIGGAEPPCLRPARDTVSPTCDVDPSVSRKSPEPDPGPDTSARGGRAESTSPPPLQGDPFLDGSLFSPHVKFVPLSKPFWQDHLASVDEVAMLNRSRTMYIDLVKSLELVSVDKETEGEDDVNDIGIMQEKMLLRCVLGPMLVKLNASLVHRTLYLVTLLQESLNSISLFASSDEKKNIAIFHPIIELHPLAQHSAGCTPGPQHDPGGPHPQPHLVIGFEYADMRLTYPMHGDLVREYLSRSGNESGAVVRDLYRKLCADVTGITVNACFTKDSQMKTEQLLTLGKLVVTGTSNQFCENEVAELQEFFRSTLQNKEFHLQDLKLSLRDKNVQVQCNLDSLNLHFNLHTHHIATHVLHSLHHFMTGMEEKTVRGYLGFNVFHDCDTLTVCLTLDSISGQWLRTRLFTCVNLTVASVGGRILKRNRYNEVTYENCVLQSGSPDSGPDKASNAQSGSSPSQPNKVAQTPDIPSHPTLTLLLQIPSQWPPNAKNPSDVKNPAATWEKSSKNPSEEKSPCSKIPPICVFKLRDLSFLADVYLYQMVNYWSPSVVSIAEGPGFDGDQQNTQNSSGLGLSRQISGGGGSQTNSSLFHTPPASLNHASYVAPPLQQDSVYSSEPSGRGSSYKATSVGTGAKHGATPREMTGSKLIKHYHIWKCLIMSIQMDNIRVYFPVKPVRNTLAPFDTLNTNVIVVKVPSVVVHNKLNFPWSVKISNVISYTTILTSTNSTNSNKKHRMELYLLKPLDVTCSIAVNIKQEPMQEADGDKLATSVPSCIQSIAFTIHINTSRVDVNICEPQVDLIHQLLNLYVLEFLSNLRSSEPWPSGDHAINGTADCHLQSDVKLSALVQWTLARMVVNLRTVSSSPSQECRKIALEIQELIVSMDYQPPSYQMIKFKMADAAVHHFKRLNFEDPWSLGDYQGVIMKVNEIESRSSNGKSAAEDTSGGFLTITLTRANSDNLHSKIGTRDRYMCIPSVHLNTITEIIIKVQPLDFILAPSTISTFLDILSPLIRSNRGATTRQLVSSKSVTYLCAKEDLDRQEFSLNRAEFNLKEEEYPEKFNLSQQRLKLNEDKTNWKKEEFNSNFEEFSLNSEEFSLNQDQSNAERIGATIKESNSNQRFGAPSDVQTRMSGSRDRSENFLSASVPSPFGTRREGSIDKTPLRKQSGTSQERQIRGSSEPTRRESKYSASWESTPGEHDGQKSVQNIRGERDGRESVEKGRSRYTECSALRMDAKVTVPREEGRSEGCDTSLRMDVTSMDVKYDMKTLEEIREMKMDEKQVRLSENAQFSSETEGIFGPEGIPHSFVHTGVKVERPLYGDRPVPSGPIDPGLEAPGATAWGRKTNPPPVVPGKRLRKISSASTIGSSEYAPVHRKVSQEKTGADLSSAKKVTQSLIGADLTSSVERKVSQSMQEERIFSKRFSTQASISESDVLSTELGASHHEPPLYPEEISPLKEAETSQIDHFQSEILVRKPKEAPRERSIDPRKISSSILKKTSSSSLGESFATKKVSLDLPTDHRAMSPAKPKVPFVSTARLPLLFLDVKNVRVIIPLEAIESGQAKREKVGGRNVASAGKTNGEADRISGGGSDPSRGGIPTSDPPLSPGGSTSLPLTSECLHDCVIVTLGGISISPQVDNPLCRVECIWSELERGTLLSHTSELELNAALIWNSGQTPGAAPNTLPLLREFSLIATLAPSIVYLYEAVIVAGTSLEINAAKDIHFSLTLAQLRLLSHLHRQLDSHLFSHLRKPSAKLPRNTAHCTRNFGDTSPVTRNFGDNSPLTRNFGDSNSALEGRQSAGMGRTQSHVEVGQSHLGAGQSNVGAGQSHVGVGQSKAGAGHNQVGAGQNTASAGQSSNVPFEMLVTGRSILVDLFDKEDNIRPMACLHLIQPDLLVKTNSLQVQASEHTIFNIYDIKVYINKSYETPTGYYDNQDSVSLAEDTKLDETDADSIEGDKSRLTKLIRDKMERQKRHQEILARDQIPLLETGTVPERKRQENGLCPVLIQVKLERTLVGKRLTGSVQKPVRLVLTEELLTRFNTVRSKINTAIHTSPNPTHCKGDQSTNCSTDTLSRGTKYRRHIENLKVKLEAYDLPSLCLNLSSGLLSLSHPFSSHLHISTLSLSTQLTSTCPPRFLVDPMEVKVGLDCAWESWYPTFLMFLNGNIEYVSVNISAYQLEVLYRIYHQYKHLLPTRHTSNNRGDPTSNSSKDSGDSVPNISTETAHSHVTTAKETASHVATAKETTDFDGATLLSNAAAKVASGFENTATPSAANFDAAAAKGTPSFNAADVAEPDQDQHYVDDLRAGAFQYIPVPDTSTRLPLSYQILYNAYSITWKYPSPRSITRIYIAPIPSLEETPNQAEYLLQYYDSSKGFTVYARLKVVENSDEVAKVDFFDVPPLKPVRSLHLLEVHCI
ncbi:hypothetical protein M8J75_014089 [Diaphorina citri]|nr:hypothetical protein M8J75_014089 [Diaphorina citri]